MRVNVKNERWFEVEYESAAELAEDGHRRNGWNPFANDSWTGESREACVRKAMQGDQHLVAKAEGLLERVYAEIDSPRAEWARSVGGAYPVVPEALMGLPDPMRRRVQTTDNRAPLRIVMDLTSSAIFTAETLRQRGITYLALTMALSNERAVELWGFAALGGFVRRSGGIVRGAGGALWRIVQAGAPVDLAVAGNALSSTGLVRGAAYGVIGREAHNKDIGDWAFCQPDDRGRYVQQARAALGLDPQDVFVPPAFMGDTAVSNPVAFVQRSLAEYMEREE
jgi:hypothetical protein